MNALVTKLGELANAKLGRCSKCMRQSFLAMVAISSLSIVLPFMTSEPLLLVLGATGTAGSILLWLAHLVAYASRTVGHERATAPATSGAADRRYVLSFARSALLAAASTALPFSTAFAQVPCRCGSGMKCCYNYRGDNYVCAPSNGVCCASNNPYYCSSGQNCFGTNSCR